MSNLSSRVLDAQYLSLNHSHSVFLFIKTQIGYKLNQAGVASEDYKVWITWQNIHVIRSLVQSSLTACASLIYWLRYCPKNHRSQETISSNSTIHMKVSCMSLLQSLSQPNVPHKVVVVEKVAGRRSIMYVGYPELFIKEIIKMGFK